MARGGLHSWLAWDRLWGCRREIGWRPGNVARCPGHARARGIGGEQGPAVATDRLLLEGAEVVGEGLAGAVVAAAVQGRVQRTGVRAPELLHQISKKQQCQLINGSLTGTSSPSHPPGCGQ